MSHSDFGCKQLIEYIRELRKKFCGTLSINGSESILVDLDDVSVPSVAKGAVVVVVQESGEFKQAIDRIRVFEPVLDCESRHRRA